MPFSASAVPVSEILPWRQAYRHEMQSQIVHDSLHAREGWTQSYLLNVDSTAVGYGAVAVAGPWLGTRTVFEFYIAPEYRTRAIDLFETFVAAAGITAFEVQTNAALLTVMLHLWCPAARSEKIVFREQQTNALPAPAGAIFRHATPDDAGRMFPHEFEPAGNWLVEVEGTIAATGGIALHYNRPYADIFMEVSTAFRRHGLGNYLIQELKRVCHEEGSIPCARCSPDNIASRRTLQKAGFVPIAHILSGLLVRRPA